MTPAYEAARREEDMLRIKLWKHGTVGARFYKFFSMWQMYEVWSLYPPSRGELKGPLTTVTLAEGGKLVKEVKD